MRVRAAITVASALFAVGGGCSRLRQASTADLAPRTWGLTGKRHTEYALLGACIEREQGIIDKYIGDW